jgi:glycosyltransferase involved in cell wall biosynthesis
MVNIGRVDHARGRIESVAPLVSIIIPTYNCGQYIEEAILSVQRQTYPHWECIVVDDGSTDDTCDLVLDYVQKDARISYIRQKNRGLSSARNVGLKSIQGRYVQFLDADDLIEPRKLERQVTFLEKNRDIDIVYSDVRYFKDDNQKLLYSISDDNRPWMPRVSGRGKEILEKLIRGNIMVVHAPLLRREIVDSVGSFDENLLRVEDWDYWLRCAIHGAYMHYDDYEATQVLVRVRQHSLSQDKKQMLASTIKVRKKIDKLISDPELQDINRYLLARELSQLSHLSAMENHWLDATIYWLKSLLLPRIQIFRQRILKSFSAASTLEESVPRAKNK